MSLTKGKIIPIALMMILFCLIISGCGGSEGADASGGSGDAQVKKGSFKIPEFKDAVFDSGRAKGNEEVQLDLSHVSDGYIALKANSDSRLKLQTIKGSDEYLYDIVQKKQQVFPLQSGNGNYKIRIMKNAGGSKYFELYKSSVKVKMKDKFGPFLRPGQYADYSPGSECIKKAESLAKEALDEKDYINNVYEYICENITYDKEKASSVKSGYIPDPDSTLKEGKGICFDYACLAASMLRRMGIPTKIIFGYVEPDDLYHAWNMFYTEEDGWSSVEFKVDPKDWSRIDLTFSANGEDGDFIGDGSNYTDVYHY